ncbi:MAG: hypothetical protein PVF04_02420 [Anaerolineae bacterium]|jgi:hypothetical protein
MTPEPQEQHNHVGPWPFEWRGRDLFFGRDRGFEEQNPYVGPRPFEWEDRDRFFGREREASELLSLIIAHRALLLYAPSGAGKTSLINARLKPLLQEEGFEVLPLARVRGLPEYIEPSEISNLFVFNTLMNWEEYDADRWSVAQMSLPGYLEKLEHLVDEEDLALPRVAIFDQFEEIFSFYRERWEDREEFFRQVGDALEEDRLLRVVFSIREDYIAQLDPYTDLLPEKLRTRFRLERLRRPAALAAVTKPLGQTRRSFAEDAAAELVDELMKVRVETAPGEMVEVMGQFIEPVQLQVVCQSLWQDLPPDTTEITRDHLQDFGDVDQALSRFYEQSIEWAVQESSAKEGHLRRWFERSLITPAGTRGTVYRGPDETGGIPNEAVDVLENLHLIRAERRAGSRWYELTHDRFIEPIQRSNEEWRFVRSLGIPENREKIIDYARRREQDEDWDAAGRAYERLLELDRGKEQQEERWTLALERVEEEGELASLYAEAEGAIGKKWLIQASEDLARIVEKRPDYRDVARLEHLVTEQRQKRKRRSLANGLIIMGTTALPGYVSGVWLADRLASRMGEDLPLRAIGAVAALSGLAIAGMFTGPDPIEEVDVLNIRGVPKNRFRDVARRFLSLLIPLVTSELMILVVGLLAWGVGALTLWIFDRFIGFRIVVWAWGIIAALAAAGLALDVYDEPYDAPWYEEVE